MKKLSEEQMAAVNAVDGQILVVSCPGSGKTTTLIARIKHMIDIGIDPTTMLNITFTKAAAEEMAARFEKENNVSVKFSTIHSFCFNVLCKEFGLTVESILKESEKWKFIFDCLTELVEKNKVARGEATDLTKLIMQEISYVKNKEIPASSYCPQECDREVFYSVYQAYEHYKSEMKKVDFDDMLILVRDDFKNDPVLLEKYQKMYKYISIDEFQDVNRIQAEIAYMLTGKDGNLFVVGDDDQSIYKFRAADSGIMLDFPKTFPNSKTIYMGTNYRSGKAIVALAGRLIAENRCRFKKEFRAFREESGEVYLAAYNEVAIQAKDVVKKIIQKNKEGVPYEDMAILYRTNSCAVPFLSVLVQGKIPFYTSEMPKSHHGTIYEEIITYYRLSRHQGKKGDVQRILNSPSRYLKSSYFRNCSFELNGLLRCCDALPQKDSAKEKIFDMMHDVKMLEAIEKPKDFIAYMVDHMQYRKDLEKKAAFYGRPEDEYTSILDLLIDESAQFDRMDDWMQYVQFYEKKLQEIRKDKSKKGVCLSTFHASKGLEWEDVFVVNANDGITPFAKAETMEDLEEERRMFYVAITRAKMRLYLSYIESRKMICTPYFEDMGLRVKSVGAGSTTTKLDPVRGLG